jgi:hypothetical protein
MLQKKTTNLGYLISERFGLLFLTEIIKLWSLFLFFNKILNFNVLFFSKYVNP